MKKWGILFFSLFFILSSSSAMAIGLGPYFNYEIGNMTLTDIDYGWYSDEDELDIDNRRIAIGFLLDTCTSQDSLFNYRLNIGYGISNVEPDVDNSEDTDGGGFDMKHTFGFGVLRTSAVRLWIGPSIKLYVDAYSEDDVDLIVVGAGGGPEFGVNIHTGGLVSIGLTFGLNFNFVSVSASGDDDLDSKTGSEIMYYFQIAPIFNLGGDRDAWAHAR